MSRNGAGRMDKWINALLNLAVFVGCGWKLRGWWEAYLRLRNNLVRLCDPVPVLTATADSGHKSYWGLSGLWYDRRRRKLNMVFQPVEGD